MVGGGPAGATAAIQALELGADVTLVEADQVGGTNLNCGSDAGAHPGPGRPAGAGLVLVGTLRPGGPPAGAQTWTRSWRTAPGSPGTPTTRRTWHRPSCAASASSWSTTSARSGLPTRTPLRSWDGRSWHGGPHRHRGWLAARLRCRSLGGELALTYAGHLHPLGSPKAAAESRSSAGPIQAAR